MLPIYNSKDIICPNCMDQDIPVQELQSYLDHYVSALSSSLRVSQEEYRMRLEKCEGCTNRIQFTCKLCGCYVQARAAKWQMNCPLPYQPKWSQSLPPDEYSLLD